MTSFAFILGVLPLVIATGAGAEMRQSLGTAVFSGMLGVTLFGLLFTPVFYVVVRWIARLGRRRPTVPAAAQPQQPWPRLESDLAHAQAAADIEHLAGDEAGILGEEEGDRRRHLLGPPDPPDRDLSEYGFGRGASGGLWISNSSVPIGPGATALTVMPSRASSSAQVRVSPIRPALVVA